MDEKKEPVIIDFATVRELALKHPDFVGTFKALQTVKIDQMTFGGVAASTDGFYKVQIPAMEAAFRHGFDGKKASDAAWKALDRHISNQAVFSPALVANDQCFEGFQAGFQLTLQLAAYQGEHIRVLNETLDRIYRDPTATKELKDIILELGRDMEKIANKFKGLEKIYKDKEAPK